MTYWPEEWEEAYERQKKQESWKEKEEFDLYPATPDPCFEEEKEEDWEGLKDDFSHPPCPVCNILLSIEETKKGFKYHSECEDYSQMKDRNTDTYCSICGKEMTVFEVQCTVKHSYWYYGAMCKVCQKTFKERK